MKSALGFRPADQVTCGGNALPFYAAVRMKLIRKTLLKTQDKVSFPCQNFHHLTLGKEEYFLSFCRIVNILLFLTLVSVNIS